MMLSLLCYNQYSVKCDTVKKELVLKEFLISPKVGLLQFLTRVITYLNKSNFQSKIDQLY